MWERIEQNDSYAAAQVSFADLRILGRYLVEQARLQALEDAEKALPEEKQKSFIDTDKLSTTEYAHYSGMVDGRNKAIQEAKQAISALKKKQ